MSFHENTKLHVKSACLFELEQAEKRWGKTYHSMHEGWAVLKEEVDEVKFNLKIVKDQTKYLWNATKKDNESWSNFTIKEIQENAVKAMMELAQVWAVCEKMQKTIGKEGRIK